LRLTNICVSLADLQPTPSTPTQQSSLAEVKQWLRWFLAKKTELSPERQTELVNKLATEGDSLLSLTKEDLRDITDTALGSMIYNALRGMTITLHVHRH